LTPVERPETQLGELYDYAMSFVGGNNHDLMETLSGIDLTRFREYKFVPASTRLETTLYFDPTNRVLASTNHIRVAYGRHYRDVTPTSGTLYTSAQETMTIDVQVVELPMNQSR